MRTFPKILIAARSTTAHEVYGGMEISFEQVAHSLHQRGYSLSLLTTPGLDRSRIPDIFENVWEVPGARKGRYSLAWWWATSRPRTNWLQWDPALVFSISTAAWSMGLRKRRKFKILAQSHGTAVAEIKSSLKSLSWFEAMKVPLNVLRVPREISAYRTFDKIIAVGDSVSEQLRLSPYSVAEAKIELVRNGINVEKFSYCSAVRAQLREDLRIPLDERVAVYTGRLHHQKGVDLVLRAFAALPGSRDHLLIAGDGPERTNLVKLAEELQVEDRVHFLGRVEVEEVPKVLSAADLFVFPTRRREGLPLNVLEALAAGLEVLTVTQSSLPEELLDVVRIVSTLNPRELSTAWDEIEACATRTCRLPATMTATAANSAYLRTVERLIEGAEA
jgi:glycosyltransferase involved in cell wall biosynthesis